MLSHMSAIAVSSSLPSLAPAASAASPQVSSDLVIETPENVTLTYRLAGPAVRIQAFLDDLVLRAALLFGGFIALLVGGFVSFGISLGLYFVLWFAIDWFYFGLCEGLFRGKTLGKHLFGLRVIKEEGYPITLWAALLRNFVRAADSLPYSLYGCGFVTMLVAGRFRRLGDLVARTVVIEERRVAVPREPIILEKIEPLPRSELGGYVPTGQTLALIEEYLGRRHVLTYQRGHALAQVLAKPLARKLNFSGDGQLVEKYPMAFLARVYATFHDTREEEGLGDEREGAPGPSRRPMRAAR